jgi:hypothetical protein
MFDHSTNKYIFLDIDGVMNNEFDILEKMDKIYDGAKQYTRDDIHFCDEAWDLLATLCKKTGAKVILSSSWRHGFIKDERGRIVVANQENHLAIRLLAYFKAYNIPLVGLTGLDRDGCRGLQILDYIAENLNGMTDEWIVLDDEIFDMEEHLPMDHVFKTSFKTGLTDEICRDILEFWGWDESVHVFFQDSEFYEPSNLVDDPYHATPNGVLVLDGIFGFKRNYLLYCEKRCFNQEHGAPLYIVTNMPYFLEKAYWNGESFNAYIWSEKDECYHNVQEYTERELRAGHNLHSLYINGDLTDHWSE